MQENKTQSYPIAEVISNYDVQVDESSIKPFGSGHINDTFFVKNLKAGEPDYLLQRVNHQVFKDVPGLTNNIYWVTRHLKEKMSGEADVDRHVLTLLKGRNHLYYYQDSLGNYWRLLDFIPDTRSYDIVETEQQAFEGGRAFGRFLAMLSDLSLDLIIDSIPNFQNIRMRLDRFRQAVKADPSGRVKDVAEEIAFVEERAGGMDEIESLGERGEIPKRILHCDTKFNNVLLDKDDKAQCVIDLDTVMAGYVACDFGDAIRTIINAAAEDEKDLSKVKLNIPLFAAYTRGYLSECASLLSDREIRSLMKGVLLLPYMQVVRFLTDYIEGDIYYKIHFPDHNLQRTRAQMQLLVELEEHYRELEDIVLQEAAKYAAPVA